MTDELKTTRSQSPSGFSRRRILLLSALTVLVLIVGLLVGLRPWEREETGTEPGTAATLPEHYPFGPNSVWRQDVSSAPLAADSGAMVAGIAQQVAERYDGVAAFNLRQYSTSFYVVGADQTRVQVGFDNCQKKKTTPRGLFGEGGQFEDVPVPDDAVPAAGRDGQLTIYSPSSDQLWELWRAKEVGGQWQACWGGRMDHASTSQGFFSGGFGSSASGLAISGGMVWVEDAENGVIDHALSLQLVDVAHWKNVSWPAQRSDGSDKGEHAVPEGTRLRLDPTLDLSRLGLSPVALMVARAAQRYGFIVVDKAGAVAVTAQTGQVSAESADPWSALLSGRPAYSVMKGFPWDRLQALPKDYGKPGADASTASATTSGS